MVGGASQGALFRSSSYKIAATAPARPSSTRPIPGGYAAKTGFEGGYFDPPIDFAKEAEAAGAYGETVRDPAELDDALQRALVQVRSGKPVVVAVWLPRHLNPIRTDPGTSEGQ